ncbi:AMIN-like domain-containing (lipo)protein [Rhodococcus kronopolitis]|uniref:AMIN-like domain-containing protein n=1 Tax=Rhodococcus kronopolitis TaxID=1460226 RepID=A0ABV9FWX1_9NOCA
MKPQKILAPAAAVLAGALLLTGCSDGPEPAAPSSAPRPAAIASASTTTASTPDATPNLPVPAGDTGPERSDSSSGAMLTVTGLRIGDHPGFDRVVYELDGTGAPGWTVAYVDHAVQDGSGDVLDVPGDSLLEVRITGTGYPFETGVVPYAGPNPLPGGEGSGLTQARITTVFEGTTQSFVGVEGDRRPFTVSRLDNPTRLVVDIAR